MQTHNIESILLCSQSLIIVKLWHQFTTFAQLSWKYYSHWSKTWVKKKQPPKSCPFLN